jgi:hypothetical protein
MYVLRQHRQDFVEIMEMLDKRLNDKGKNWRHVFKSLTLLDYLLHAGSENVVHYFTCAFISLQAFFSTLMKTWAGAAKTFTLSKLSRSFSTWMRP